jgi:hypothetical protein
MTANQAFKAYKARLEVAAKVPGKLGQHSRAKLALLSELDRVGQFQWYCANVLGEDEPAAKRSRSKRTDVAEAVAEVEVQRVEAPEVDEVAVLRYLADKYGFAVIQVEDRDTVPAPARKPAKQTRKASTRSSKSTKSKSSTEGNKWNKSTLKRLGYPTKVGKSFRHTSKAGTSTWTIVSDQGDAVIAVKA